MITNPVLPDRYNLGEGALWADGRLYWFDILTGRLLAWHPGAAGVREWAFGEPVSAAATVDKGGLMIASASALLHFDPTSGAARPIVALDCDDSRTRSNDGRADRQGGFWISTMGRSGEMGLGAIWRFYRGEVRRLISGLAIPNAICFSPDGKIAYFADSSSRAFFRWPLTDDGWPVGEPQTLARAAECGGSPDGAVVDSEGCIWNARWGAGLLVRLAPDDGRTIEELRLTASQPTCPAFGGPDLTTLYVTSAYDGLGDDERRAEPDAGAIFGVSIRVAGLREPSVELT